MAQTSYNADPAVAVPGQISDMVPHDIVTRIAEEALEPGRMVIIGTDPGEVRKPYEDSGTLYGVVVHSPLLVQDSSGVATYAAGTPVPIMRKGRIYMPFDGGTQADQGTVNIHAGDANAGEIAKQGKATATATSANVIRASSAKFFKASTALASAGLALIDINMP